MRSLCLTALLMFAAIWPQKAAAQKSSLFPTNGTNDAPLKPIAKPVVSPAPLAPRTPEEIANQRIMDIEQRAKDIEWTEARVASFVPAEFESYRVATLRYSQIAVAPAAIAVMRKMRELLGSVDPPQGIAPFYRTSWEICLRVCKRYDSPESTRLVIEEWDRSFELGEGLVGHQLDALTFEFDDRFLTDGFWKLFEQTESRARMSKFCNILYHKGGWSALDRLRARLQRMSSDDPRCQTMHLACCLMKMRLQGGDMSKAKAVPYFY